MNRVKRVTTELPDGWILCESKSSPGRKYYFNKKTGKSSWTEPGVPHKFGKKGSKEKPIKDENQREKQTDRDFVRKKLKRKNDGPVEDNDSNKKIKSDQTPRQNSSQHPSKRAPIWSKNKKGSPDKISPSKNKANLRLSQLRASLAAEVAKKETNQEESPKKSGIVTEKNNCIESQKNNKDEQRKENLNDSKCQAVSLSQSPINDSVHLPSTSCPSQFFTANRIIFSMKSQLPEEYEPKVKQKNTYADIEKDICSQTPEYPSTKHPATPPQFSEASKLVSAIKSKLSYNFKDESVKTYTSAKERMEGLRKKLSIEAGLDSANENSLLNVTPESKEHCTNSEGQCSQEAMEVEETKEMKELLRVVPSQQLNDLQNQSVVLVVDTNIFIRELDFLKNAINSHIKGYTDQPTLLVPWRVVNELDRLKDNNNGQGAICKRARAAMDYLYKSLPENNRIKGQSLRDANCHIYPCEVPDDEILNCCLQQQERAKTVMLLSNDKNLCNKAMMNNVKCVSLSELQKLLENKPQPTADPDLEESVKLYKNVMYQLLSNILENEMRAKYNNLWQHVVFKPPPWTLLDVLQCLLKHWIAVFNEVFPRIEHIITDLKNALVSLESKDPKTVSRNEGLNFKDLCLDLAKKCQIIPEYMELAKSSVERLERKFTETKGSNEVVNNDEDVIAAFETVWTVFSSYCAKLSSELGVHHDLEDILKTSDTLEVLVNKLPVISSQIIILTQAIKGTIQNNSDSNITEFISLLETIFKEGLLLVNFDCSKLNTESLKTFCCTNRNMLQEAFSKFSKLNKLLEQCKSKVPVAEVI